MRSLGRFRRTFAGLSNGIKTLPPACFAMVMATGIVAIAAGLETNSRWLAEALGWLNAAFFAALSLMTIARVMLFPHLLFADFKDFDRGPGFFTIIAGIAVTGAEMIIIFDYPAAALLLWLIAIPLWVCVMYAVFAEFTINEHKPRFEQGINGGWLISVVATQAIAALGARLAVRYPAYTGEMLFFALAMWLAGGMLYLWLISLIFYRFTFFRFRARDFIPPFWINMGAMAISTLAGTNLIAEASSAQFMKGLLPFLKGFTIFFWATATWWIPMLAILAYWQHIVKKQGFPYTFMYWDVVFPIGMYTVCTYHLTVVMDLPFLAWVPQVFVYIAAITWVATLAGMLRNAHSVLVHLKASAKPATVAHR